jgi:methyl-accepting chemotaxis protein
MEGDMTTKLKIIIGCGLLVILLCGVSGFGYVTLRQSAQTLISYRGHADINTLCSDMATAVVGMLRHFNLFVSEFNPESMDRVSADMERYERLGNKARSRAATVDRQKTLDDFLRRGAQLKPQFKTMRDIVLELLGFYNDRVHPDYRNMDRILSELSEIAYKIGNIEILYRYARLRPEMAEASEALGFFSESLSQKSVDRAVGRIAVLREVFNDLKGTLTTEIGRKKFGELMITYERLVKNVATLQSITMKKDTVVRQVRDEAVSLNDNLDELSSRVDREADNESNIAVAANRSAENALLSASVAGLLAGTITALLIVVGMTGVLKKLSAFATAIAEGDFSYNVRIAEKGEVGDMVAAIRTIPAVLNEMVAVYEKLADDIRHGRIQSRADASRFRGGFATLINGTNTILNNLGSIIDRIPTPVLMLNRETKAVYLNLQAKEITGSDGVGRTCGQLFNREDTDTSGDALKRAMDTKNPASAETRCLPRGRDMYIAYTAMPTLDERGNVIAVMEIVTDLTALKETEHTIQKVAGQASGIADRLAAASTHLSARIEQVSHGAKTQRARTESTASAMNEMNSTVLEVARNAGRASEQSGLTRDKAAQGADLVNRVVDSINHVNGVAATLQNNMRELGSQAESIGGVMNVISDIADQTNLLALNAAIEAARAGDAGRGFAVVADEVRKLAEKTMSATQEVGSSIRAVQQSATNNIREVGSAVTNIGEATELADSSGEALKEIVNLAVANSAVVASIATAAEEQSATSEEINHAVEEISRIVNDTAEGMAQSSSEVLELSRMAQELSKVMEQFKR